MKSEYEHTSKVSKSGPDRLDGISDLKSARHVDLIIARFLTTLGCVAIGGRGPTLTQIQW